MSAYLVSKATIDAIVFLRQRAADRGALTSSVRGSFGTLSPDELGRALWRENMLSLRARYAKRMGEQVNEALLASYSYSPPGRLTTAVEFLKIIACYEYQSCEHDGWETSDARALCRCLAEHAITQLPGYDDAPWGLP